MTSGIRSLIEIILTIASLLTGQARSKRRAEMQTLAGVSLPTGAKTYNHKFSLRSERELKGVDSRLVEVTRLALQLSSVDFMVVDGTRTAKEQHSYYRKGTSQRDGYKRKSNHQLGDTVDLVPIIGGQPRWREEELFVIAKAMRDAARLLGHRVRWGGSWQELNRTKLSPRKLAEAYIRRRGKRAFVDTPHYEIID